MAGGDSQKQLLSLIRDFATEKSQGERRVSDLRKRTAELRPKLDAANAELENAKRCKETTEHDLKGSEVELSINEASIQAQEARTYLLQDEISKIGSDLGHLKNDEGFSRDDFIEKMFELNKKLRKLQETTIISFHKEKSTDFSSYIDQKVEDKQALFNIQDIQKAIKDKLVHISAQTHEKEQECNEEENIHNEVLQELTKLERKVFLMEAVVQKTKELQDLARQTAESEMVYASLGELLQRKYACPGCKVDNMADSQGTPLSEGT